MKQENNSNPMNSLQKKAEAWYHQSEGFDKMDAYIAGYLAGQQKTATGEPGEDQEGLKDADRLREIKNGMEEIKNMLDNDFHVQPLEMLDKIFVIADTKLKQYELGKRG